VALTDPAGKPGLDHAADLARTTGVPLETHAIEAAGWHNLYGVGSGGVVLVRPDGYVAWRTRSPPETPHMLASALRTGAGYPANRDAIG
jgi:putative polyketide hydroxylase